MHKDAHEGYLVERDERLGRKEHEEGLKSRKIREM